MRIPFNNHFDYINFREQVLMINRDINCLTFQTRDVLDILKRETIYTADYKKSMRQCNRCDYERISRELGFMPIWVFNPLQFGTRPQTTWDDDWFREGSLWNRFLEDAKITREAVKDLYLLEISINPIDLYRDPVYTYGYISVTDHISKNMLLGHYRLEFPDEDADDWLYPWLYPAVGNSDKCSFKETKQYIKERKFNPFTIAINKMKE